MKDIPKSFQLLAHTIDVEINNEQCLPKDCLGLIYTDYNKIYVATKSIKDGKYRDLPISQIEHAFYHELVHAILSRMNRVELNKDEEFVDMFSGLLQQSVNTMTYHENII